MHEYALLILQNAPRINVFLESGLRFIYSPRFTWVIFDDFIGESYSCPVSVDPVTPMLAHKKTR